MRILDRIRLAFSALFASEQRVAMNWSNFPQGFDSTSATTYKFYDYCNEGFKQNPIVYACIDEIGRASKAIKLVIKQDGEIVPEEKAGPQISPLYSLLKRPNPYQALPAFLYRWSMYMQAGGISFIRGYGLGTRPNLTGELVGKTSPELRLIRPDKVTIQTDATGNITHYEIPTASASIDVEDMTFTIYPDPLEEFMGLAPMKAAAETIDAHSAAITWNRNLLQKGGVPLMALIIKGMMNITAAKRQELQDEYRKQYAGAKNAGTPLILAGEGADAKVLSSSARDLDWRGGKQDMMRDICADFGVPSRLLGDPEASTYSNVMEARKGFYIEKILPDMRDLVGELTNWVMPKYGLDNAEFDIETAHIEALQESETEKVKRLVAASWLTINEKREAHGYEGDMKGGDDIYMPYNLVPLGQEIEDEEDPDPPPVDGDTDDEDDAGDGNGKASKRMLQRVADSLPLPQVQAGSLYPTEADRLYAFTRQDAPKLVWERKWAKKMRAVLKEQLDAVLAELGQYDDSKTASGNKYDYHRESSTASQVELRTVPDNLVPALFGNIEADAQLAAAFEGMQVSLVAEFGQQALDELTEAGLLFDMQRPALQDFLAKDLAIRSRLINQTTATSMQRVINASVSEGQGVLEIRARLLEQFNTVSPGRARAIAQTEVGRAANQATLQGYTQAGVEAKEWVSARDANVRDTHAEMDGQVVALDGTFDSPSGATAEAPGFFGVPSEDINCRCVIAPLEAGESGI